MKCIRKFYYAQVRKKWGSFGEVGLSGIGDVHFQFFKIRPKYRDFFRFSVKTPLSHPMLLSY